MIPIYRAKKINSDEYVEGYYVESINYKSNIQVNNSYFQEIDPTTLAIHFPDMIDSQGNKIFASLSEDGKGGDMFNWDNELFIIWFDNFSLKINATNKDNFQSNCHDALNEWYGDNCYDIEVIGVQQ